MDYTMQQDEIDKQHSDPAYQRFKLIPPKGWTLSFHPGKLFGSDYSEGTQPQPTDRASKTAPTLAKAVGDARHHLQAAFLPKEVAKMIWKVEDVADELAECDLYSRHG